MLTLLIVMVALAMIAKVAAIIVGIYLLFRVFGWLHQSNPRLAWSVVAAVVVVGSIAALGLAYVQRAKVQARAESAEEERQRRRAADNEARDEEARAAEAGRASRADLFLRWNAARRTAISQWREDLVAAQAVGRLGVAPPMLSIEDNGSLVAITNRSKDPVCVLVARVATRDSAVLSRCTVGGNRCVLIQGGATARWTTLRTGNSESCLTGTLEYRVGDVDHPDPSWWSESALAQFGNEDPDPEFSDRWSDAALLAEIDQLEKRIGQRMRLER